MSRLTFLALLTALLVACGQAAAPVANPAPAPPPAAVPAQPNAPAQAPAGKTLQVLDRMVIHTAQLRLTVADPLAAVDQVEELARRYGGLVASTNVRGDSGKQTATVTIRVPVGSYADAMRDLRRLATRVDEETSSAQDVTEQYADVAAQLRNLQATEAQYLELLKKAQTTDDVLKVQQRLSEVRGQIERLQGQMQVLQRRTDYSEIQVTLNGEPTSYRFDPGRYARPAWEESLRTLEAAIGALVYLWWIGLLGVGGYFLLKRTRRPPST